MMCMCIMHMWRADVHHRTTHPLQALRKAFQWAYTRTQKCIWAQYEEPRADAHACASHSVTERLPRARCFV